MKWRVKLFASRRLAGRRRKVVAAEATAAGASTYSVAECRGCHALPPTLPARARRVVARLVVSRGGRREGHWKFPGAWDSELRRPH